MDFNSTIDKIVSDFQLDLDNEAEIKNGIRTVLRELDRTLIKQMNFEVQGIHQDPSDSNLKATGSKILDTMRKDTHSFMTALNEKIPLNQGYKFSEVWQYSMQKLAGLVTLAHFLKTNAVAGLTQVAEVINVPSVDTKTEGDNLFLDYEDYLVGLLEMASDLSRLTRNIITFGGEINTIFKIHECLTQLNTGLHYVTFKNDHLRRRYDGLKYNIKVVEGVTYDLRLRNMVPSSEKCESESKMETADVKKET